MTLKYDNEKKLYASTCVLKFDIWDLLNYDF